MRPLNLTGQMFGRLSVLSRGESTKAGKVRWLCRCHCGSFVTVVGSSLLAGLTRSCGCLQRDTVGLRALDLKGKRFSKLLTISRAPNKRHRDRPAVYWYCICDCGIRIAVRSSSLLSGNTKSCGCLRAEFNSGHYIPGKGKIDLSGKIFGLLTVLNENGRAATGGGIMWLCRCRCGKETTVCGADLRRGETVSCGCARHRNPNSPLRPLSRRLVGRTAGAKRRRAIRASEECFTPQQILDLLIKQHYRCANPACPTPRRSIKTRFDQDHIMPIVLGGSNSIENIQLLCPPCNNKKRAKDPFVWAQENGFLL